VCGVDYDLEPGKVRKFASLLWKNGKGYTVEDLEDFKVWWNAYDWRGAKNHTFPHLKQVVETIRQSYEHPSTQRRRDAREAGFGPDHPGYIYISGRLADFVNY
jgi:hypothetical protein